MPPPTHTHTFLSPKATLSTFFSGLLFMCSLSSLSFTILCGYRPGCHVPSDVFSVDLHVCKALASFFFFSVLLPWIIWQRDLQLFGIEYFAVCSISENGKLYFKSHTLMFYFMSSSEEFLYAILITLDFILVDK